MKQVYVVSAGIFYEGDVSETIEVFKDEQAATDYALWLEIIEGYSYTEIFKKNIFK